MIDRHARDEAVTAIVAFLNEEIGAFEFDDRLAIETDDATVDLVVSEAWFFYDDCKDHPVCLSKVGWDYFQRLILLLKSDLEVVDSTVAREWSWSHGLALAAVLGFLALAVPLGWGVHLCLVALPFGLVSMWVSAVRARNDVGLPARELACVPFDSFAEIRRTRHCVTGFRKMRYRRDLEGRRIRNPIEQGLQRAISGCAWLCFSPVVLLLQALPSSRNRRVTLSDRK